MNLLHTVLASLALVGPTASAWSQQPLSRRSLFQQAASASVAAATLSIPTIASAAASKTDAIVQDLKDSQEKLKAIPNLLDQQDWESVRSILKTPPVNKLWNLGDSQNPVLVLAKETGNIDLFELKDELAYSLQLCDQYTYSNVFIYYQPGDGKVKIKEPKEFARKAISQLQEVIES